MKCKFCGGEIANDSKFCEFCGKKVKRKKKWPWIVVGIIVVVIALLINHLLCEHYRKQEMIVAILNRLNEQEQIINSCGDIMVVANGTPTDDFEQIRKKLSNCEEVQVEKRNIMVVMVNSDNNILVDGEQINIDELKTKVKEFLGNPNNDPNLSDKEMKIIPELGEFFVSKGVISLQKKDNVDTNFCKDVELELDNAIFEMRDELSKNRFNTQFFLLEVEKQSMAIREAIPRAIIK